MGKTSSRASACGAAINPRGCTSVHPLLFRRCFGLAAALLGLGVMTVAWDERRAPDMAKAVAVHAEPGLTRPSEIPRGPSPEATPRGDPARSANSDNGTAGKAR